MSVAAVQASVGWLGGRLACIGVVLMLLVVGACRSGQPQSEQGSDTQVPASRSQADGDYMSGQAGRMTEEDARGTSPSAGVHQEHRPAPIRPVPRSPVDQPRLR